jgi:predicted metal-dependent hydrolase
MSAIPYTLRRSSRKTLGIRIHPDGSVHVTAPLGASQAAVDEVLLRKASWILRKQAEVRAYVPPPEHQFLPGEPHLYLGQPYLLKLERGARSAVALTGSHLYVRTPEPENPGAVAAVLERWYLAEARRVFAEELAAGAACVLPLGIVPPPAVRIRRMKSRWGSCTAKGVITLNLRLIQVERSLIQYVVVHELCHLREHNHSRAYYRLLDQALPGWRGRRQRLNAAQIP